MKRLVLLALLLPLSPAQAASPQAIAQRLTALIPDGYSEGTTTTGQPCRVIFSSMLNVNPNEIEYARAQVIAEPDGNLVDVEIFFDGYQGKVSGTASSTRAEAKYRELSLSATKTPKGILVKAKDRSAQAECVVR